MRIIVIWLIFFLITTLKLGVLFLCRFNIGFAIPVFGFSVLIASCDVTVCEFRQSDNNV